ncbi:MAG: hypothetical protein EB127_22770 [Alphaproteobacteria bacterium]|nr:hypothetical protein [Alphaproteobacteria bacterium]
MELEEAKQQKEKVTSRYHMKLTEEKERKRDDAGFFKVDIKGNGWCFYNTLLKATEGAYSRERSMALAKLISKWLDDNKNTPVHSDVPGGENESLLTRFNRIFSRDGEGGGKSIPVYQGDRTSINTKLTFDEYLKLTVEESGSELGPKVWPELEISGHAAANLLNIEIHAYTESGFIGAVYRPIEKAPKGTVHIRAGSDHFDLLIPKGADKDSYRVPHEKLNIAESPAKTPSDGAPSDGTPSKKGGYSQRKKSIKRKKRTTRKIRRNKKYKHTRRH